MLFCQEAAFGRVKNISTPHGTGAVLCGHKQMAEVCVCSNNCPHLEKDTKVRNRFKNWDATSNVLLLRFVQMIVASFLLHEVTSLLVAVGVSTEKILKNFWQILAAMINIIINCVD